MFVTTAIAIGVIVGFAMGGLGGGGSVLTVPALVYLLGETPRSASSASLIIVGISALIGLAAHIRGGQVRWVAGAVFGLVGTGAAVLGTLLSKQLDPNVLMLCFAGIILLAAAFMVRQATQPAPATEGSANHQTDKASSPPTDPQGREAVGGTERTRAFSWRQVGLVVVAGVAVGFATGLFGVGGGFLVVPGLVLALGYPMQNRRSHLAAGHRDQRRLLARPAGVDRYLRLAHHRVGYRRRRRRHPAGEACR